MSLLNCLKDFVPSESNLYSEDEMRDINIRVLEERGVTVDDIAQLAYGTQSKYLDDLTIEEMKNSVLDVLGKRDQFHAIILTANIDAAVEQNLFSEPLNSILKSDLGLFGIDEAIALSIAGNYGTIGQTNFGYLDVSKPGKINILQRNKKRCNCFLDDVVGALAALAAIRVAQKHAIKQAMATMDLDL